MVGDKDDESIVGKAAGSNGVQDVPNLKSSSVGMRRRRKGSKSNPFVHEREGSTVALASVKDFGG